MARFLFKFLLFSMLLLLLVSPVLAVIYGLQSTPLLQQRSKMAPSDVTRVKDLIREHDPRSLDHGQRHSFWLTERELNLLANYALPAGHVAGVNLVGGGVDVLYSAEIPENPLGRYLNIYLQLTQVGERLEVRQLTVGRITLPGWAMNPLVDQVDLSLGDKYPEYRATLDAVESIRLGAEEVVQVTYHWDETLVDQLQARGRDLLLPPEQRARILAYYDEISAISRAIVAPVSVSDILAPLFGLAESRSRSGAAAEENRALLIALGMAVRGSSAEHIAAPGEPVPPRAGALPLTLRGREDLAKHFLISAALAAGGGAEIADAIGVFKELSDAQGGTGFSFPDLLADRAGVVLAERATGAAAGRLQSALATASSETLFMPHIDQLPEGLQDIEFRDRFQDLDSQAYGQVKEEVERRISALPLYR